jgi:hypothetical protein
MEAIVLTDDELKRLETPFGPVVRHMGPWNSDGVFGYASVPIAEDCGSVLIERIVAAYREFSLWSHPPVSMNSKKYS